MKRTFAFFAGCIFLGFGCSKNVDSEVNPLPEDVVTSFGSARQCASHEVLEEQLRQDPARAARMQEIERVIENEMRNPTAGRLVNGVYEIPVVVNVLYKTAAQNISQAQIQSQIDVLNKDFSATNTDYNNAPAEFAPLRSGNTNIRFVLVGVVRKATNKSSWMTNDAMKKSSQGGISPTNPTTTLNMWSCNMSGGILGYAQFPGGSSATDGVVCDDNAFGITSGVYGAGRTATHEVGHWLNLRHIWGDATCGNDQVNDTPVAQTSNGGCPTYPKVSSCSGKAEMTMNYMDYTYDACMYMFTIGQKDRMTATFAVGGGRNTFAQP